MRGISRTHILVGVGIGLVTLVGWVAARDPAGNCAGSHRRGDLRVAPLDGQRPPQPVAKGTSASVDGAPDGKKLLYMQAHSAEANGEQIRSGSLRWAYVLDENGSLRDEAALPRPGGEEGQELAVVAFTPLSRVRWRRRHKPLPGPAGRNAAARNNPEIRASPRQCAAACARYRQSSARRSRRFPSGGRNRL